MPIGPDGSRVFVTSDFGPSNYTTVAFDSASGAEVWRSTYTGSRFEPTLPASIAVSGDGQRVFVTGTPYTGVDQAVGTVAYDAASGSLLWVTLFDQGPGSIGTASELAVSPDSSRVFVTGVSSTTGAVDFVTVAYRAASGSQLWVAFYDGPAHGKDIGLGIAVRNAGVHHRTERRNGDGR